MIEVRKSGERGFRDKGWLQSHHTFSFDTYYDPEFLGFHPLIVLNEDVMKGGKGFGTHSHKEIEILTYMIDGVLEHRDSMGNTSVVRPGEVLSMSAGTGITHSEYNLSHHIPVHFLQIWVRPDMHALEPSYAQKLFSTGSKWGQWRLIASRNGREGSLRVHQDMDLYATLLDGNDALTFDALDDRHYWIHIVSGKFLVQESILETGDGAAIEDESTLEIRAIESGELLLFDFG